MNNLEEDNVIDFESAAWRLKEKSKSLPFLQFSNEGNEDASDFRDGISQNEPDVKQALTEQGESVTSGDLDGETTIEDSITDIGKFERRRYEKLRLPLANDAG